MPIDEIVEGLEAKLATALEGEAGVARNEIIGLKHLHGEAEREVAELKAQLDRG